MLINEKQFKKIKVETKSGQALGRLSSFDLETNTGQIMKYYVKAQNYLAGLFANSLLIDKDQIISFDNEKMIVQDNVIKVDAKVDAEVKQVEEIKTTEPAITSEKS